MGGERLLIFYQWETRKAERLVSRRMLRERSILSFDPFFGDHARISGHFVMGGVRGPDMVTSIVVGSCIPSRDMNAR